MGRWVIVILGLLLMGCQNPMASGSTYSTSQTSTASGSQASAGPPYTVTYRNTTVATTGSVPVDSTAYASGATVTVLGNTGNLSWPPFTFVSWNTQNNGASLGGGGGTTYLPGATFSITANTVLFGTWR